MTPKSYGLLMYGGIGHGGGGDTTYQKRSLASLALGIYTVGQTIWSYGGELEPEHTFDLSSPSQATVVKGGEVFFGPLEEVTANRIPSKELSYFDISFNLQLIIDAKKPDDAALEFASTLVWLGTYMLLKPPSKSGAIELWSMSLTHLHTEATIGAPVATVNKGKHLGYANINLR